MDSDDPHAFDPDEMFDPDFEPKPPPERVMRATIVGGRVTLTHWNPLLAEAGPVGNFFRLREREGVAIADLRILFMADGTREVVVEFMAAGRARAGAERALRAWATHIGYRRIWFPGGPIDLSQDGGTPGTASVACPTCRAEWIDSTPNFWSANHNVGHFPIACPLCGGSVPQWTVTPGDATNCRGAARRKSGSTTRRRAASSPSGERRNR